MMNKMNEKELDLKDTALEKRKEMMLNEDEMDQITGGEGEQESESAERNVKKLQGIKTLEVNRTYSIQE